jgi:predicted nucleic acid-binding Zn ribbon protein
VERQKKIKVIELNAEVPKDDFYHGYVCQRCELHFAVRQDFEDQDIIVCNSCRMDDQVEDIGQVILYKGVMIYG